jgi:hypothetical protein
MFASAVQAAQAQEREDHVLVLPALERVADQVRDTPEQADDLAVVHTFTVLSVSTSASPGG